MASTSIHSEKSRTLATAKHAVIEAITVAMRRDGLTKSDLARRMRTSRSLVNRMLDPRREITVGTLVNAAAAIGKRLEIRISDLPASPGARV